MSSILKRELKRKVVTYTCKLCGNVLEEKEYNDVAMLAKKFSYCPTCGMVVECDCNCD